MTLEYKIISENCSTTVSRMLSEHLQQGWNLHGNLCTSTDEKGQIYYTQAIVKEVEQRGAWS